MFVCGCWVTMHYFILFFFLLSLKASYMQGLNTLVWEWKLEILIWKVFVLKMPQGLYAVYLRFSFLFKKFLIAAVLRMKMFGFARWEMLSKSRHCMQFYLHCDKLRWIEEKNNFKV